MQIINESKNGINYLLAKLRETERTVTKISLWRIPHNDAAVKDIALKIGRYQKAKTFYGRSVDSNPESASPKSELTLDNEEFLNLIHFLQENYEAFRQGVKKFIPLDEAFNEKSIDHLKAVFINPDKEAVVKLVIKNEIISADLIIALQNANRIGAVKKFAEMLKDDLKEQKWQDWFKANSWVLGTEFIKVLDERSIDTENITDFLMQAYDGFLDIVEIKRPEGELTFWANSKDHNNLIPSQHLIKAITQATNYIYEVEREVNSIKFQERIGNIKIIKPRCILIFGRSSDWIKKHFEAYRILNSCFHNITVLTYDQVLERAKRIVGLAPNEQQGSR